MVLIFLHHSPLYISISIRCTKTNATMCNHTQTYGSMFPEVRVSIASVIIILSLLANLLFLVVLSRVKSTREIKNDCYGFYLIHLSSTNLFASLVCIITAIAYSKSDPGDLKTYMRITSTLHILSSSLSIETIALMTLERFKVIPFVTLSNLFSENNR